MLSKPSYDLACPISTIPYSKDNKPKVLVCGHTLASKTIADMQRIEHEDIVRRKGYSGNFVWIESIKCPTCRKESTDKEIKVNYALYAMVLNEEDQKIPENLRI